MVASSAWVPVWQPDAALAPVDFGTVEPGQAVTIRFRTTAASDTVDYRYRVVDGADELTGDLSAVPLPTELPPISSAVSEAALGFTAQHVDARHQRVFISSKESGVISVFDFAGERIATLEQPGAGRMTVVERVLYVGTTGGTIERFDAWTLEPLGAIASLGAPIADLAYTLDRMWVTTGSCSSSWTTTIHSIDPVTGAVDVRPLTRTMHCPWIAQSPALPGVLFLAPENESPASIVRLDVRTNPPTSISRRETFMEVWDMDVSSDGEWLVHAGRFPRASGSGGDYGVRRLSTADLTSGDTRWVTGAFPKSIAVAPDDSRFAVSLTAHAADVWNVDDTSELQWRWIFDDQDDRMFRQALGWSSSGTRLFAVAGEHYTYDPHVVHLRTADVPAT